MIVHILDPAKDDLAEGFWFYESRDQGLGHYFLDTIYAEIDKLESTAGIHPMYEPPFFQMLSDRFPFTIYYRMEGVECFIEAIVDQRRDPEWISERLN
jgi:hypothetical protein